MQSAIFSWAPTTSIVSYIYAQCNILLIFYYKYCIIYLCTVQYFPEPPLQVLYCICKHSALFLRAPTTSIVLYIYAQCNMSLSPHCKYCIVYLCTMQYFSEPLQQVLYCTFRHSAIFPWAPTIRGYCIFNAQCNIFLYYRTKTSVWSVPSTQLQPRLSRE